MGPKSKWARNGQMESGGEMYYGVTSTSTAASLTSNKLQKGNWKWSPEENSTWHAGVRRFRRGHIIGYVKEDTRGKAHS